MMAMTWRGVLAPLGGKDAAGRQVPIRNINTDVRQLPLPLRVQQADWGGHQGAMSIGTIDRVWIESNQLWGEGRFDEENETAVSVFSRIKRKFARHISVDLEPGTGKLMAATLVDCPAFEEAQVMQIHQDDQAEHLVPQAFAVAEVGEQHVEWGLTEATEVNQAEVFAAYTEGAVAYQQFLSGRLPEGETFNWVDDVGGLPSYIKRIAKHLKAKGMNESRAIATAVNAAKKMCATGDVNWPGSQQVNAGSRAEACAAVASWEAKKARARAS